jgi:hypothetical protein
MLRRQGQRKKTDNRNSAFISGMGAAFTSAPRFEPGLTGISIAEVRI